jgi:hypothetical protein
MPQVVQELIAQPGSLLEKEKEGRGKGGREGEREGGCGIRLAIDKQQAEEFFK